MPLSAADTQWRLRLPADRHAGPSDLPTIRYGDYFSAAADYLQGEGREALARVLGAPADDIQVHLVKHGAFYHPAHVTAASAERRATFVLNVAVSPAGRERLAAETAHLRRLGDHFPERFVPRVFGSGRGQTAAGEPLPMFLGEWLDGFHEWHPSDCPEGRRTWSVWDPEGRWNLGERQVAELFRQASFILTYYLDPYSLEAVQAWHHAAGDFVVRARGDGLAVRLITVRRYAPLFRMTSEDLTLAHLLEALAIFFLRTSLWMRVDRLDGVGDLVWAEDRVLAPIVQGFLQGLESIAQRNGFPPDFLPGVRAWLAAYARQAWIDLGESIIGRFPPELPEALLLRTHLPAHADILVRVLDRHQAESGTGR